jgi:hypothetical protein
MEIKNILVELLPEQKKVTALEEAQFEDYKDPDGGFGRERTQQGRGFLSINRSKYLDVDS